MIDGHGSWKERSVWKNVQKWAIWYKMEKKVRGAVQSDELGQVVSPIECDDTEYVLKLQDTVIMVDDWQSGSEMRTKRRLKNTNET